MTTRWICPHCQHAAVIGSDSVTSHTNTCTLDSADGNLAIRSQFIACPNPDCKRITLSIWYGPGTFSGTGIRWHGKTNTRRLFPPSSARPFPTYVPEAIRSDYEESCSIVELSPKASATLARRALQGIVRDFHGIVRKTLFEELEALKPTIDPLVWKAIDAVRSVGNIGAHMEKDINVIVDVEPDEAARLIRLIEMLISEWYVARHNREDELAEIVALGEEKKRVRATGSGERAASDAALGAGADEQGGAAAS